MLSSNNWQQLVRPVVLSEPRSEENALAFRSFCVVAIILGNSWIAGRNFSCRSQTLSERQQGIEPAHRVHTRERGLLFCCQCEGILTRFSVPTDTLLTHCRRYGSTGDVVRIPEDLQAAWLQGTQHGDALVLSSVSGVVRSLGKRTQGLLRRS